MTDADLLTLSQWLSPSFPIGAFAYSHGLEQVLAAGDVTDVDGLGAWLDDVLYHGSGLGDAVLLCAARAGRDDVGALARAMAPSRERWIETRDQGAGFAAMLAELGVVLPSGLALPVAVGMAVRGLDIPAQTVASLYLQGMMANLVSVAVRVMPMGQGAGQRVVAARHPAIRTVAERAVGMAPEDLFTGVPGADLAAMRHEVMEVRLFRS